MKCPDEDGIETLCQLIHPPERRSAAMKCPDEDGIETSSRRNAISICFPQAAMKCPDEDGIETSFRRGEEKSSVMPR